MKHDSTAVNLFNKKMLNYLKEVHGEKNVKKLFFFSDGSGSQYKNKFNFLNLVFLMKSTGINVEWNFSATSHGKSACDGIGATVKRNAYRVSLQRPEYNQILTPKIFYNWAINFFEKVSFDFCTENEHDREHKALTSRYKKAITIKNTRQYHCFKPSEDGKHIMCRKISSSNEYKTCAIRK